MSDDNQLSVDNGQGLLTLQLLWTGRVKILNALWYKCTSQYELLLKTWSQLNIILDQLSFYIVSLLKSFSLEEKLSPLYLRMQSCNVRWDGSFAATNLRPLLWGSITSVESMIPCSSVGLPWTWMVCLIVWPLSVFYDCIQLKPS